MLRSTLANLIFLITAALLALAVLVRDGQLTAWRYLVELLDLTDEECRTLTAALWRGQTWALHEEAEAVRRGEATAPFADEAVRFEGIWRRLWRAHAMDLEAR